jgi:hypothetical protein
MTKRQRPTLVARCCLHNMVSSLHVNSSLPAICGSSSDIIDISALSTSYLHFSSSFTRLSITVKSQSAIHSNSHTHAHHKTTQRTHTMAPKRNSSAMDLSAASPVIQQPTNLTNDTGSATKGVGALKGKRTPLVRSGGSGSNSGSQQSLLGFSSRKNAPVTPEKKKSAGVKRKVEEVGDEGVVKPETMVHPLFAKRTEETMAEPVQSVDADPLLLASGPATKEMEHNLTLDNPSTDLSPSEQAEQTLPGTQTRGLAVRKAMLAADQRIKVIREIKPPIGKGKPAGKGKASKAKGGLDPNDKKWSKVYKESWKAMGGDDIAPSTSARFPSSSRPGLTCVVFAVHTTPQTHTKIHHILRVFDLSPQYGPCVGISRLARWERAKAWGLEPPEEVSSPSLPRRPALIRMIDPRDIGDARGCRGDELPRDGVRGNGDLLLECLNGLTGSIPPRFDIALLLRHRLERRLLYPIVQCISAPDTPALPAVVHPQNGTDLRGSSVVPQVVFIVILFRRYDISMVPSKYHMRPNITS